MRNHLAGVLALASTIPACDCGTSVPRLDARSGGPDARSSVDAARFDTNDDAFTPPPPDVHVVITADNSYGFGWGTEGGLTSYFGRPPAGVRGACDIFCCPVGEGPTSDGGPERYVVPGRDAPDEAFVYVVAWADRSTTQGLIGQFEREGRPRVFMQDDGWEVCATGIEYDTSDPARLPGPDRATIDAEIVRCNAGTGDPTTSSAGWVGRDAAVTPGAVGRLVVGEANMTDRSTPAFGNEFPVVCTMDAAGRRGMDPNAHWVWYSPSGAYASADNPFIFSAQSTRPFLIFRLAVRDLPR